MTCTRWVAPLGHEPLDADTVPLCADCGGDRCEHDDDMRDEHGDNAIEWELAAQRLEESF